MSDFGEIVLSALTGEWRTTKQIAESIPLEGRTVEDRDQLTRHHLSSLVRYGLAERRRADAPYRWVYEWRLAEVSA